MGRRLLKYATHIPSGVCTQRRRTQRAQAKYVRTYCDRDTYRCSITMEATYVRQSVRTATAVAQSLSFHLTAPESMSAASNTGLFLHVHLHLGGCRAILESEVMLALASAAAALEMRTRPGLGRFCLCAPLSLSLALLFLPSPRRFGLRPSFSLSLFFLLT